MADQSTEREHIIRQLKTLAVPQPNQFGGTRHYQFDIDVIAYWHLAHLEAAKRETAKAYGGCTSCYGKGYATASTYASARGKQWRTSGPMQFCKCDRGQQLEAHLTNPTNEEPNNRYEHTKDFRKAGGFTK